MAHSGLDLKTDRSFQIRFWHFQRFAWLAFLVILLIALAGLTGKGGPLSRATASGPQGSIDYPRVTRWEMTDDLTITLPPRRTGKTNIDIDNSFSKIFQIEDIQPAPTARLVTGAGQRLIFDLAEPAGKKSISIHVRPLQPSLWSNIPVWINDGEPLVLTPVVLP